MKTWRFYLKARFIFLKGILVLMLFSPGILSAQRAGSVSMQVQAAPAWNQVLGDTIVGQPFLQNESAVIACTGGSVKSFYMTGTALWSFEPSEQITPFIARSMEGAAYLCDSKGVFRVINRVGRQLWQEDLKTPITYSPVVGWDGRVFIPAGSQIFCRTASGNPLWTIDLGSPMAAPPVLDHVGSFVTVLENRDFVKVNQFSAVERVHLDRVPLIIVSIKSGSYVLLYSSGEAEKLTFDEGAARGSALSRERFPSLPAAPAAAAAPALTAGRIDLFAVTLRDGRVLLMSESGQVLWTGNSHEAAVEKGAANLDQRQACMVFDERGIYSISTRGVTGFALDGRRRFVHKMQEASSVPSFSDEGLLYVCGKDKLLYVYKLDNKPRTVPRSKYYGPDPEGSYGMGNPPPSPWVGDSSRFDDDNQRLMYDRIERVINSGQIGENEPIYVAYLMEMIGFFLNDPHYSRARPSVKPPQHIDFIRLLGRVGSRETIPFLYNIFDKYHEPSIKSACAEAIGTIGVDPYGNTFESYNYLLAANNPNRDPQLLLSATSSIAALCRFSGPPLSGDGIMILRFFSNLPWAPNTVKNQIRQEVDNLYREGFDRLDR